MAKLTKAQRSAAAKKGWRTRRRRNPTPKKPPSIATMTRWMNTGIAKATDGCKVEPDGYCPHGKPSWLIKLGYI